MAESCFLSFTRKHREVCDALTACLESAGIRVVRYDPENLWGDPAERMATAVAEEVGCLVLLRLNEPLTQACLLEFEWAERCGLPIVCVDNGHDFQAVVEEVLGVSPTVQSFNNSHERYDATLEHFLGFSNELEGMDSDEEYAGSSELFSDSIGAAREDSRNFSILFSFWIAAVVGTVVSAGLGLVFLLTGLFFHRFFLIGAALAVAIAFALSTKAESLWRSLDRLDELQKHRSH